MRFNIKLLAASVATLIVLVAGVYYLHAFQVRRTAGSLKENAVRERDKGHPDKAAEYMRRYLGLVPTDIDALVDYADLRDKLATTGREHYGVLELYERILRRDPQREEIRRLAIQKAMFLGRWADARQHIELAQSTDNESGELYYWKGLCQKAVQEKGAAESFQKAYKAKPTLIDSYFQHALILRAEFEKNPPVGTDEDRQKAIKEIDEPLYGQKGLVANNRESPAAYLALLRYLSLPPVDAKQQDEWKARKADAVTNALKYGPDEADLLASEYGPIDVDVLLAAAAWAKEDKKPEQQREFLTRGVEQCSNDLRFYDALSVLELEAGNKKDAENWLRKYLATPQVGEAGAAQARYSLGEILVDSGKLDDAKEVWKKQNATSAYGVLLDAHIRIAESDWWEAARRLEKIRVELVAAPNLARRADLLLATCYEQMHEPDLQLAACQRAVALDPAQIGTRAALAAALAANGRLAEAREELRRLADASSSKGLNLKPDQQFELEFNLAQILASQLLRLAKEARTEAAWKEVDAHLEKAELALKNAKLPSSPRVPLLRAEVFVADNRFGDPWDTLKKAQEDNPKEVELWIGLAGLFEQQGKPEDALKTLDKALNNQDLTNRVELQLALVRYWAGQHSGKDAKELSEQAISELSNLEKVASSDRFPPAEKLRLLTELAEAHAAAGRAQDAKRLWTEISKKYTTDLHTTDLRSLLALVDFAVRESNKTEAERLIDEIKKLEGEDGTWWRFERAAMLLVTGKDKKDWADADILLREAGERRPTWARIPRLQGQLAEKLGKPDRAIEYYQRAVELGERDARPIARLLALLYERRRFSDGDLVLHKAADNNAVLPADVSKLGTQIALSNRDRTLARKLALQTVTEDDKDYRNHLWLAFVLANLDDPKALQALKQAKTLKPDAPEVWVAGVAFYYNARLKARDPKTAKEMEVALKAAVEDAKENLDKLSASVALAECYDLIGRTKDAEVQYKAALTANPTDPATLRSAAAHYQANQQPLEAERLLRTMLDPKIVDPKIEANVANVAWARRSLALVIARRGDASKVEEALGWLRENLQAKPDSLDDVRAESTILATQTTRLQEAIDLYEQLDKSAPLASEDLFRLAQLHDAAKDWPKARERMNSVIAKSPDNLGYLFAFANALIQHAELGDAELGDAENVLKKITSLPTKAPLATLELEVRLRAAKEKRGELGKLDGPVEFIQKRANEPNAPLLGLASLMEGLGKIDEAQALFLRFAQEQKKPEDVLQLALFYGRTDRPTEGLRICDQARATPTCLPEQWSLASVALVRSTKATEEQREIVERWLEPVIKKMPTPHLLSVWAELQDLRGGYADTQGRHDEAKRRYATAEQAWRAVIDRQPNHVVALNNLACQLAFTHTEGEEPLKLINGAIMLAGAMPELLDTRGLVYLAQGKTKTADAIGDLELAVQRSPTGSKYFHLARAYLLASKTEAARDAWRKAEKEGLRLQDLHPLEATDYEALKKTLGQ